MRWPEIPYAEWSDTCSALHLYAQIVGKYRLARTPWVNHSWHATLYVNGRGLTTSLVPDEPGVEVQFDLIDHALQIKTADGDAAQFPLAPMSVADFHAQFREGLRAVGADDRFHGSPNEVPDPVAFAKDDKRRPYNGRAVSNFHGALKAADAVFKKFRTGFVGKVSPVHLFWGSFDLAVTRFSGQKAPPHPGGIPALPDVVTREAYSHEVSSAGFWPGGGATDFAAFYSYAYPAPDGFARSNVRPDAAYWLESFGEFILPYDDVRKAREPETTLMSFLQSTYEAAAALGDWDRDALECEIGEPLLPRKID